MRIFGLPTPEMDSKFEQMANIRIISKFDIGTDSPSIYEINGLILTNIFIEISCELGIRMLDSSLYFNKFVLLNSFRANDFVVLTG